MNLKPASTGSFYVQYPHSPKNSPNFTCATCVIVGTGTMQDAA